MKAFKTFKAFKAIKAIKAQPPLSFIRSCKYLTARRGRAMALLLCAYAGFSCLAVVLATQTYWLVQPAILLFFVVASLELPGERPFF